jgi:RimJ/RimL family protein N-acetyltransferase
MIRFNHPADGDELTLLPGGFNPKVDRCVARLAPDGKLLGGVTYEKYTNVSICMHVRSFDKHWLTRDLLWVIFHYPFVQLNCLKVLGFLYSSNQIALEFDKKIGFKEEYRIKDACPDGADLVVMSMLREDCRWLNIEPRGIRYEGASK